MDGTLGGVAPRLVGRARECDILGSVLGAAERGLPGALLVHGEAGVGKTRLVREATSHFRATGSEVLWGTCVRFGSATLPYASVASALDRWVAEADGPEAAEVLAGLGQLSALIPSMRSGLSADHTGRLLPLFDAALLRIAERAPTVLVVDDLHWADVASLDLLAYLVTGFRVQRFALVATIRMEDRPEGHPLHAWLADVRRLPGVSEITLDRMCLEATEAQVAQLMGRAPSEELAHSVHQRSQGNAYMTELLVRELDADLDTLPSRPPEALRDAVLARWHSLSRSSREVARVVALGGRPITFDLLDDVVAAALPDVSNLRALLREAVEGGVLKIGSDRTYWFWHPLLAEVLEATYHPGEADPVHAAYAAALEAVAPANSTIAADIAVHHEKSGDLDRAFRWSLRAADHARALRATAEESHQLARACALWERVTAVGRGCTQLIELLSRASQVARATGDYPSALRFLTSARALVDPDEEPLLASSLLLDWLSADWASSPRYGWYRPEIRSAIALTDAHPHSPERARAFAVLAEAQCFDQAPDPLDGVDCGGLPLPGHAAAQAALAASEGSSPIARADALTAHAMVHLEDPDSQPLLELAEVHELVNGKDAVRTGHAAIWQLNRLHAEGRLAEAAEMAVAASAEALNAGASHDGHFLAALGAAFLIDLGAWDRARQLVRPALASGSAGIAGPLARCAAALLAARCGNLVEARRHLDRLGEIVQPDFIGVPLTEVTAEVLLAEQNPRATLGYLGQQWPVHVKAVASSLAPLLVWGATAAADLMEQARDGADQEQCEEALAALQDLITRRARVPGDPFHSRFEEDWSLSVMAARFAAECARCRDEKHQAEAWQTVVTQARRAGLVWEEALASRRLAEALVHESAPRERIAASLRSAHSIARALGAIPLVEEVSLLAAAAHIQVTAVDVETAHQDELPSLVRLTRREHEVLNHVAVGRTNAEIAAALFISDKTVSVHVSNILRKTGHRSRVEAAAWARRVARR